ncbi:MAG: DNA polymerase I, partial [Clostridia bacterium]|nr:DNA polymerase I [Clostridia bacterium]
EFAKKNGYAQTLFGRKRQIREINAANYNLRTFGERVAMNMPLQGSAADIMKIAMINVNKALKDGGLKSRLILQVHDELVIDAFNDELDRVRSILVDCMENAVKLSVPLTVEVNESNNWYDCK